MGAEQQAKVDPEQDRQAREARRAAHEAALERARREDDSRSRANGYWGVDQG